MLMSVGGSFLPVAGREASVVKIYVFPEIAYKLPSLKAIDSGAIDSGASDSGAQWRPVAGATPG